MPRKKKDVFSKVKAVKDLARETVGTPRPTRALPDPKTKAAARQQKHKPKLSELLAEE
ncbi:MAG TPA: hypothetical protein VF786_02720 [Terriglobales bacterium]